MHRHLPHPPGRIKTGIHPINDAITFARPIHRAAFCVMSGFRSAEGRSEALSEVEGRND
jgi:hypothetical protein